MAKAAVSDDVIKVGIVAILIAGIYVIYQTVGRAEPVTTIAQKPFTWVAEGTEYWTDWIVGLPADIVKAVDPSPDRKILRYDENSWLWGWGPQKS